MMHDEPVHRMLEASPRRQTSDHIVSCMLSVFHRGRQCGLSSSLKNKASSGRPAGLVHLMNPRHGHAERALLSIPTTMSQSRVVVISIQEQHFPRPANRVIMYNRYNRAAPINEKAMELGIRANRLRSRGKRKTDRLSQDAPPAHELPNRLLVKHPRR